MARARQISEEEVLAILGRNGKPMSAYDILADLRPTYPKVAPPTVYRLLATLAGRGEVHRLESLNAFVACSGHAHNQAAIMSICDECGTVEENVSSEIVDELTGITGQSGFAPSRHVIEVHGVCADCNDEADTR